MMVDVMAPDAGGDPIVYSDSVRVESKVFYFDLKENARGAYLKVTEKSVGRPRLTVIVPAAGLQWFIKVADYYIQEGQAGRQSIAKELAVENKVYYFTTGQNAKGTFLRVTEAGLGHPTGRNSLVIPAAGPELSGWSLFKSALLRTSSWLQLQPVEGDVGGAAVVVGPGHAEPVLSTGANGLPVLVVGPKTFFLDPRQNERGKYVRITEVVRQDRTSVVIPGVALPLFQQALSLCSELIRSP